MWQLRVQGYGRLGGLGEVEARALWTRQNMPADSFRQVCSMPLHLPSPPALPMPSSFCSVSPALLCAQGFVCDGLPLQLSLYKTRHYPNFLFSIVVVVNTLQLVERQVGPFERPVCPDQSVLSIPIRSIDVLALTLNVTP